MIETVMVRLDDEGRARWVVDGEPGGGSLEHLARLGAGRRVVIAAPGEHVLLASARVTSRSRATLLRALPYALEESLAEDVEELHFAASAGTAQDVAVAVVRHEDLSRWLSWLSAAHVVPAAVVPEPLLLPYQEGCWSVLLEAGRAVVRTGRAAGFTTDTANLGMLLGRALAEAGEHRPESLRVWGEAEWIAPPGLDLERMPAPRGGLPGLAAGTWPPPLDLLQGRYSRRAHLGRWLRPWRAAAALVATWMILQLGFQVADFAELRREVTDNRAEMEALYRRAVPGAVRVVNPRVQLEQALRELERSASGSTGGFLALLHRGAAPLVELGEVSVEGLRYKENQLDLEIEGGTLELMDRLERELAGAPDASAQVRTTVREGRIRSQVTLTGAGA